jgi:hypothetical protein
VSNRVPVGIAQLFHEELRQERRRGRATYTELEESDADLARHKKWLAAIRARDYFDAPGGEEAAAAVASCEEALARFESDALSASSTSPCRTRGRACARSKAPTADKPQRALRPGIAKSRCGRSRRRAVRRQRQSTHHARRVTAAGRRRGAHASVRGGT